MSMLFISIPLMIFLFFVAPIWLFLHYRSKKQINEGLTSYDVEALKDLSERAEKLQRRVQTLERILDVESPDWRRKNE